MSTAFLKLTQTFPQISEFTEEVTIQRRKNLLFELVMSFTQVMPESEEGIQIKREFETMSENLLCTAMRICSALILLKSLRKSDIKTESDRKSIFLARCEIGFVLEQTKIELKTHQEDQNLLHVQQMLQAVLERF